ncbi:MAG: peptidoglycan DD-metalloendopeptidase family protein [Clostridia bacterium]|nr:peptidoglycan DD-metalloendopeptidase family protein [Clostridia bacterium]
MDKNNTSAKRRGTGPRRTRIAAGVIAAVLALLMIASVLVGALGARAWVTQGDIDKLKGKLATTTSKKKELKADLDALASDKAAVKRQIALLDEQIELAEEELELQEELLVQLAEMIELKTLELADSRAKQEQQYADMKLRIRFMAEHGRTSYLTILLSADSFAEFLNRFEIIGQISTYEMKLYEELRAIKEQIELQKAELEATQEEERAVKVSMEENKASLEAQRAEKQARMESIEREEREVKEQYKKMIEEEDALMEDIRKKAAELAAQKTYVGGTFMWPLPASNNVVTCKYGMRTHPITGVYKLHSGVDLRASTGTKVYAANGGTVVTSTYSSAWGNYVVINHGGGYTTLYAHLSKRSVKANQTVSRGDIIGYSGNTGYSTAPHLHFEISKDGKTYNPLNEFKGFDVVYK